ncbi:hypothetical protein BS78_04G254900 [Paspalum vaginatum]|nr:hypothetical protein BS78_04G254900 [Paspalum vaginatum]
MSDLTRNKRALSRVICVNLHRKASRVPAGREIDAELHRQMGRRVQARIPITSPRTNAMNRRRARPAPAGRTAQRVPPPDRRPPKRPRRRTGVLSPSPARRLMKKSNGFLANPHRIRTRDLSGESMKQRQGKSN